MDALGYRRVDSVFLTALELSVAERQTYLNRACGDDPELQREVIALLRACELSGDFLERPAFVLVDDEADDGVPHATPQLAPGTMVGHHRIVRLLGEGGMGAVYLAQDEQLNRRVALKVLSPALAENRDARARFLREAQLTSKLEHPNICTVYTTGETDGVCFISMRLVVGETLRERLRRDGALDAERACAIGVEIARALRAAHAQGVLHRDVTSGNVMLGPNDEVTVLDFGIAGTIAGSDSAPTRSTSGLVRGTPAYMSPEQARRETLDARSDVFSLGVLLYEMVTGKLPFTAATHAEMLNKVINEPHQSAHAVSPVVPRDLSALLDRALAKSRDARYASVAELIEALQNITARSAAPARGRAARSAAVALLVVAVTAGIVALWTGRSEDKPPASHIESIAVLPFVPHTAGDEPAAFALDMTETLIARLSQVPDLVVRPLTAVRDYPDDVRTPLQVGRAQAVDVVLDGGVQHDGTAIRVNARLTRVADGAALWSDTFDAAGSNLFGLQNTLADAVTAVVSPSVARDRRTSQVGGNTGDPQAYRWYALGRYHADRRSIPSMRLAIEHYERALARDPDYANAWAALGEAQLVLARAGQLDPDDGFRAAREAALRALALDDALVEPQLVLGRIAEGLDWDWAAAERHFLDAVNKTPNHVEARRHYARFLSAMGRFEAGVEQAERSLALAPASLTGISTYGFTLFMAGEHARAVEQMQLALEMNPEFGEAYFVLGMAEDGRGNYQAAIRAFETANNMTGLYLGALGMAYAHSGQREAAAAALRQLQEGGPRVPAIEFAVLYTALGRIDEAFAALEQMVERHAWNVHILKAAPQLDLLRSDLRYAELLERTGLADYPAKSL